jgi:hypothetical protein
VGEKKRFFEAIKVHQRVTSMDKILFKKTASKSQRKNRLSRVSKHKIKKNKLKEAIN